MIRALVGKDPSGGSKVEPCPWLQGEYLLSFLIDQFGEAEQARRTIVQLSHEVGSGLLTNADTRYWTSASN
jgi:hypothetical protein